MTTTNVKVKSKSTIGNNLWINAQADSLICWYEDFWCKWSSNNNTEESHLLLVFCSLIIDSALPKKVALEVIIQLITDPDGEINSHISVSAQRFDNISSRRSRIYLSKKTLLAIHCWNRKDNKIASQRIKEKKRSTFILRKIKTIFKNHIVDSQYNNDLKGCDISHIGNFIAHKNGFPQFLNTAIANNDRPTSQSIDDPNQLTGIEDEFNSYVKACGQAYTLRGERLLNDSTIEDTTSLPPGRWQSDSKELLRKMCTKLLSISGEVNTTRKEKDALLIFEDSLQKANQLYGDDSTLHICIKYAMYLFIDKGGIKASTLRTYLDRAVINGLLNDPDSYNISEWPSDDFEIHLENRLSNTRLERTRKPRYDEYKKFYKYLEKVLDIEKIHLTAIEFDFFRGSANWKLFSPREIDNLIHKLIETNEWAETEAGVAIAIGYYLGLRAGELINLTVSSVIYSNRLDNVDIRIQRGKTKSARRSLCLDKLAPKWIQELIIEYSDRRLKDSGSEDPNKVMLFGHENKRDGYVYRIPSDRAKKILKIEFGEDAIFHQLRHCFCTNLMLRWYATRRKDFVDMLRDQDHEIYQSGSLAKLDEYFNNMPVDNLDLDRPHDLLSMCKLTGHFSPETLLVYYVHSLHIIREYEIKLLDDQLNDIAIPTKIIQTLVPKMKSSASIAKLNGDFSIVNIANHTLGS